MQFCLEYNVSGSTLPPPARISAAAIATEFPSILVGLFQRLSTLFCVGHKLFQMVVAGSTSAPLCAPVLTSEQSNPPAESAVLYQSRVPVRGYV